MIREYLSNKKNATVAQMQKFSPTRELERGSVEGDSATEMRIRAFDSPDMSYAVPNPNCFRHSGKVPMEDLRIQGLPTVTLSGMLWKLNIHVLCNSGYFLQLKINNLLRSRIYKKKLYYLYIC